MIARTVMHPEGRGEIVATEYGIRQHNIPSWFDDEGTALAYADAFRDVLDGLSHWRATGSWPTVEVPGGGGDGRGPTPSTGTTPDSGEGTAPGLTPSERNTEPDEPVDAFQWWSS